jgi:DNA-directed RNA polymerase specialized sigma24 family protein
LIERELAEGFREAMKHLSQRQRACLELRAQGLRFAEIANVLGIQISTAAEYVRRGIEELKKWSRTNN